VSDVLNTFEVMAGLRRSPARWQLNARTEAEEITAMHYERCWPLTPGATRPRTATSQCRVIRQRHQSGRQKTRC
jgi:hypothetical protein